MSLYAMTDANGTIDLTTERVAELTGWTLNRLAGLFGATSIGTATVHDDDTQTWGEVFDVVPETHGLFVVPSDHARNYTVTDIAGEDVGFFAEAIARIWDYTRGRDKAQRILSRYGRLCGLSVTFETLDGQSPSDWLDVIAVNPTGDEENYILPVMREYWAGDTYGYTVSVTTPTGEELEETCFGFIGDAAVLDAIREELSGMLDRVSAEASDARRSTTSYRDTLIGPSKKPITRGHTGNYSWSARTENNHLIVSVRDEDGRGVDRNRIPNYVLAGILRTATVCIFD